MFAKKEAITDSITFLFHPSKPARFSLLACFFIFSFTATAQKGDLIFEEVNLEDLKMQYCNLDSTADAMILFDKGEVEQFNDGSANLKIHTRIKLFKKTAYDEWANVKLPAFKSSLSKLKGATYTLENGQVKRTELSDEHIFKLKEGKNFEVISFTFPGLKEGAIVEYSYVIKLGSWALPTWSFQSSIPTRWSSYKIMGLIDRYQEEIRGSIRIDEKHSSSEDKTKQWVMANVPAFKPEPLMAGSGIYKSAIRFWRKGASWGVICESFRDNEDFGGILDHPKFLKNIAEQITSGINDPQEKIKAISKYIKSTIKWDGTKDYLSDVPKVVIENKTGSSGDINLIFGSLLKQAGLDVNMVLISTRDHGLVLPQFAARNQFDYVICRVTIDSTSYLFDGTERNLAYNVLPTRCLNYDGLVISKGGCEWIKIKPNTKFKKAVNVALSLSESGTMSGSLKISREGYDAFLAREVFKESGEEEYKKELVKGKSWVIEKSEIENPDAPEKAFKEEYAVQMNDEATSTGDIIYVNPIVYIKEASNPFVAQKREYPIDFVAPVEKTYVLSLEIPENYQVEELPQSKVIKLPNNDARAVFNFSKASNKIFVSYNFQLNKTLYFKEEYGALREFYEHLTSKMSDQIVLKIKK